MDAIRNWFTPATREKIYTAIAALAPIVVTAGIILPGQVEPILALVAAGLQMFGGALALFNLKPTEAARWFGTVGRGVIYGGATVVAGAVVTLGFVTGDWAATALQYTSFGLTALAAVLAVVTPKEVTFSQNEIANVVPDAVVVDDAVVTPELGATIGETLPVAEAKAEVVEDKPVVGDNCNCNVTPHTDGRDL